jgi:uncharacterized membrane protein
MQKGSKHEQASPICDKIVFSQVEDIDILYILLSLYLHLVSLLNLIGFCVMFSGEARVRG